MRTLSLPGLFASTKTSAETKTAREAARATTAAPENIGHRSEPSRPAQPVKPVKPSKPSVHSDHFESVEPVEPARAAGAVSARIVAERFIQEINQLWSRNVPLIDDLWQPPGE